MLSEIPLKVQGLNALLQTTDKKKKKEKKISCSVAPKQDQRLIQELKKMDMLYSYFAFKKKSSNSETKFRIPEWYINRNLKHAKTIR